MPPSSSQTPVALVRLCEIPTSGRTNRFSKNSQNTYAVNDLPVEVVQVTPQEIILASVPSGHQFQLFPDDFWELAAGETWPTFELVGSLYARLLSYEDTVRACREVLLTFLLDPKQEGELEAAKAAFMKCERVLKECAVPDFDHRGEQE